LPYARKKHLQHFDAEGGAARERGLTGRTQLRVVADWPPSLSAMAAWYIVCEALRRRRYGVVRQFDVRAHQTVMRLGGYRTIAKDPGSFELRFHRVYALLVEFEQIASGADVLL
jgi:hypothetical protein